MNADPSIAIQRAEVLALSSSVALQAVIGAPARVYDRVPANAVLPYMTVGADEIRDESTDVTDGAEVTSMVTCWSAVSKAEAKAIAAIAITILNTELDLSPDHQSCVTALVEEVRHLDQGDGELFRSIITVTYGTEPTA